MTFLKAKNNQTKKEKPKKNKFCKKRETNEKKGKKLFAGLKTIPSVIDLWLSYLSLKLKAFKLIFGY